MTENVCEASDERLCESELCSSNMCTSCERASGSNDAIGPDGSLTAIDALDTIHL